MATSARATGALFAQLASTLRLDLTISRTRRLPISDACLRHTGQPVSRSFSISAASSFASTSSRKLIASGSDDAFEANDTTKAVTPKRKRRSQKEMKEARLAAEANPGKPKRKRRTPEEMEAARLEAAKTRRRRRSPEEIQAALKAKAAFGVPLRSNRRTRSAMGAAIDSQGASRASKATSKIGKNPTRNENEEASTGEEGVFGSEASLSSLPIEDFTKPGVVERLLSEMTYDHLPPRNEWKEAFPIAKQHQTSYRYFVSNRSTVQDIISHLGIDAPDRRGEKVTIVEGYPGPGIFASELLKLEHVEKIIALESAPPYFKKLEILKSQLEEKQPGAGDRLDMLKASAYQWETYSQLFSSGKLAHLDGRIRNADGSPVSFSTDSFVPSKHADESWQKLSPIIFFAQLPNTVYGEQLFAQAVSAIASRSWLFRHGRVQLGFICGESLAIRCLAEAGERMHRGKLGTTVQCLADVQVHKYAHEFQPHGHHFFPPTMSVGPRVTVSGSSLIPNSNPSTGLSRTGMVMMTVTPKREPLVDASTIEAFEFITRNLFILRTRPVGDALTHVAPGGQNVLKMTSPDQVEKGLIREDEVMLPGEIVGDLTNVQWACLARMFEKWPFRPKHLFEEGRVRSESKGWN